MKHIGTILFIGAWVMVACTSTPPVPLPASEIPNQFDQNVESTAPLWPAPTWWEEFHDQQLNELILRSQAGNWDMYQASACVRQADARARQAGAAFLPTVDLKGNSTSYYGSSHGLSDHETDYGAWLGVGYGLDFWGKHRDSANSADASRRASEADRATVALADNGGRRNHVFPAARSAGAHRERTSQPHSVRSDFGGGTKTGRRRLRAGRRPDSATHLSVGTTCRVTAV